MNTSTSFLAVIHQFTRKSEMISVSQIIHSGIPKDMLLEDSTVYVKDAKGGYHNASNMPSYLPLEHAEAVGHELAKDFNMKKFRGTDKRVYYSTEEGNFTATGIARRAHRILGQFPN